MSQYDSSNKWIISVVSGILFLVIASPVSFSLSNTLFSRIFGINTIGPLGCPNIEGLILHAIIFILIARSMMM